MLLMVERNIFAVNIYETEIVFFLLFQKLNVVYTSEVYL